MKFKIILTFAAALGATGFSVAEARPAQKSTITFGKSEKLTSRAPKKRNFKHDIEAVSKAHDTWKKAHLNTALYACQRNGERVAELAKQVSDKIEAAKKAAVAESKALEKTVADSIGADATEIPENLAVSRLATLKAKLEKLKKASRQATQLERLAGQVMMFYQNDVPKMPAAAGDCTQAYPQALRKGTQTSEQYHADAEALSRKLEQLVKLGEVAVKKAELQELVAQAR